MQPDTIDLPVLPFASATTQHGTLCQIFLRALERLEHCFPPPPKPGEEPAAEWYRHPLY